MPENTTQSPRKRLTLTKKSDTPQANIQGVVTQVAQENRSTSTIVEVKKTFATRYGMLLAKRNKQDVPVKKSNNAEKVLAPAQLQQKIESTVKEQANAVEEKPKLTKTQLTLTDLMALNKSAPEDKVLDASGQAQDGAKDITEQPRLHAPVRPKASPSAGQAQAAAKTQGARSGDVASASVVKTHKSFDAKAVTKQKLQPVSKVTKSDLLHVLYTGDEGGDRHAWRKKKNKKSQAVSPSKIFKNITMLPRQISAKDLAAVLTEPLVNVTKELMKLGMIVKAHEMIDPDVAELVATSLGHSVERISGLEIEQDLYQEDPIEDLLPRPPVVTVIGHVDHGKTSLIDALRHSDLTSKESGGITQQISAYKINCPNGRSFTIVDTPGHAAFSMMRQRGSKINDIAILIIAADDGIKPQTIEAIEHAKSSKMPIIVAVNKIDKQHNLDRIKNDLLVHDVVIEEFGGDVMLIPISAKLGTNLDKLVEAIFLIADMHELKANPKARGFGVVLESNATKQGILTTLLVKNGSVSKGDVILVGTCFAKIKKMIAEDGVEISRAEICDPAKIYGFEEIPKIGEVFHVIESEKQARAIAENRMSMLYAQEQAEAKRVACFEKDKKRELRVIIKADSYGSLEAILESMKSFEHDELEVKIVRSTVGALGKSDILDADTFNAVILAFNIKHDPSLTSIVESKRVEVMHYTVIYHLLDEVRQRLSDLLQPEVREEHLGSVEIREVFDLSRCGKIAGSYITKGLVKRGAKVRIIRNGEVVFEGVLEALKRFKEDVKEVKSGYECGIMIKDYQNFQKGDVIEVFDVTFHKRTL
ncbi:Translation initiation factor IF-2 [Rickettsiales endosymbiont of Paramecium tredecaurelia]|nr:Translation initiation factor IF-2 [Candidatus Sarmatiella mevalonica]